MGVVTLLAAIGRLRVCRRSKRRPAIMMLPEVYIEASATLGESPAWDAKTQTLYWIDVLERRVYAGRKPILQLDHYVGCLAPRKHGGLVIAQRSGIWTLDADMKRLRKLVARPREFAHNRFNDGKCDARGRFLAGTMDHHEKEPSGALYSVSPDGEITRLLRGLRISNGMAWSPDGKTLYFTDTPTREIMAFDYDQQTGEIWNYRVIIHFEKSFGFPDGMTTDTDGNLWIAMWGGARVSQWSPTGTLLAQFGVPALNVTSCAFGGPAMNELYITTAMLGMDKTGFKRFPQAGAIFRMETNVTGMPTFEFGG